MSKSLTAEARDIALATELIKLGARPQVLEGETGLSRERRAKLYKELVGKSPPKGMLPFSTDWFIQWQPNIHGSLFANILGQVKRTGRLDGIEAIMKAYRLYIEQIRVLGMEPVLSVTRAWTLVKFLDANMLAVTACRECSGHFVVEPHRKGRHYVCGLCNMPARAGKTKDKCKSRQATSELADVA